MKSVEEYTKEELVEILGDFLRDIVMNLGELLCCRGLGGGFLIHPKAYEAIIESQFKNFIDKPGSHGQGGHTFGGLEYEIDYTLTKSITLFIVPLERAEKERVD